MSINDNKDDNDNEKTNHNDNDGDDTSNTADSKTKTTKTTTTTTNTTSAIHNEGNTDLSGEAAGVVRGVSRSIIRSGVKGPMIGRLPATRPPLPKPSLSTPKGMLRQKVSIKRVAKISDRLSTGIDVYSEFSHTAPEEPSSLTNKNTKTTLQQRFLERFKTTLPRVQAFTTNLVKNTLLGMAVFETYGYVVASLASDLPSWTSHLDAKAEHHVENDNNHQDDDGNSSFHSSSVPTTVIVAKTSESSSSSSLLLLEGNHSHSNNNDDDDIDDEEDLEILEDLLVPDEYERASIPVHFGAGWLAGSVHGIFSSIMEQPPAQLIGNNGNNNNNNLSKMYTRTRFLFWNTLHHSLAHSVLFGSYECIKRYLLGQLVDFQEQLLENDSNDDKTFFSYNHHHHPSNRLMPSNPSSSSSSNSNPKDNDTIHWIPHYGMAYMAVFGIAGGMAGQVQHVVSWYTEQWFGLSSSPSPSVLSSSFVSSSPTNGSISSSTSTSTSQTVITHQHRHRWLTTLQRILSESRPPPIRPMLWAFPPSAIGFIAFEYGKKVSF